MEDPVAAAATSSSIWASLNSWFTNSTLFFLLLNLMIATIVFTSNLPDNNHPQQQHEQQEQEDPNKNPHSDRNQPQIARSPSILHRLKSFNLYPQKTHHDSSPEAHYNQQPLEVTATQYVFNQNLDYQHFDFYSTNSDQTHDMNTRVENVTADYHFTGRDTDTPFDFEPTRQQTGQDSGFNFDPTRRSVTFDLEPTRKETRFDFEPALPGIGNDTGSVFDRSDQEQFESLDEVYSKLKGGGHDRTKSDGSIPTKPPAKMKKSASLKVGFAHLEEEEIVEARRPATVKVKKSAAKVIDDDVEVDSRADDFINKFKNDLKLQRMESIIRTKGATNRGTGR